MNVEIHEIHDGTEPHYPCWMFLPECSEWQWHETPMVPQYVETVFSHWSPGGRPEAPQEAPF